MASEVGFASIIRSNARKKGTTAPASRACNYDIVSELVLLATDCPQNALHDIETSQPYFTIFSRWKKRVPRWLRHQKLDSPIQRRKQACSHGIGSGTDTTSRGATDSQMRYTHTCCSAALELVEAGPLSCFKYNSNLHFWGAFRPSGKVFGTTSRSESIIKVRIVAVEVRVSRRRGVSGRRRCGPDHRSLLRGLGVWCVRGRAEKKVPRGSV